MRPSFSHKQQGLSQAVYQLLCFKLLLVQLLPQLLLLLCFHDHFVVPTTIVNEGGPAARLQLDLGNIRKHSVIALKQLDDHGTLSDSRSFRGRYRRDTEGCDRDDTDESLTYEAALFDRPVKLRLRPYHSFIGKDLRVQYMSNNSTWLGKNLDETSRRCYHIGSVDEDRESVALINACHQQLRGLIQAFNETFFIEPYNPISNINESISLRKSGVDGLSKNFSNTTSSFINSSQFEPSTSPEGLHRETRDKNISSDREKDIESNKNLHIVYQTVQTAESIRKKSEYVDDGSVLEEEYEDRVLSYNDDYIDDDNITSQTLTLPVSYNELLRQLGYNFTSNLQISHPSPHLDPRVHKFISNVRTESNKSRYEPESSHSFNSSNHRKSDLKHRIRHERTKKRLNRHDSSLPSGRNLRASTIPTNQSEGLFSGQYDPVKEERGGAHDGGSRRRVKRSHSTERHVELMLVADAEMHRFHGADLEHYLLTLMAIVASIYRDPSIGNSINIVVVKVVVLDADQSSRMVSKNAATTLKNFCKWQHEVNAADDNDPNHHDTAVLITRMDICRSNQKCDTLGLAELGTMCDAYRSCSIIKDSGLSAAYTVAHELGHVFSLRHDDECGQFAGGGEMYHAMAPTLDHETKPWLWSECSRNKMTEFLDSGLGECLNDDPIAAKRYPVLEPDPRGYQRRAGSVYSADAQCAQVFERGSKRCPYMPVCKRLWCTSPDYERTGCRTQHMPWADGTPCSSNKDNYWCYRGQCIPKMIPTPIDGGWGEWMEFGPCTRTCGGGIQQSMRNCDNPPPEHGGKYCIGRRIKYRSCNHDECPAESMDFREHQCASFNGKHFNINGIGADVSWVAKYAGIATIDRCKLFCRVASSTAYYQLAERVIDGTKCAPDTTDVCIMGRCRKAGCDHHLGSNTTKDKCGVCGGDNSNCRQMMSAWRPSRRLEYGYNSVIVIPKGATNIDIRQYSLNNTKYDDTYLALTDPRGHYLLNGNFIVSAFNKEMHISGTIMEYTGSATAVERINGTGMIQEDLYVHVLTVGDLIHTPNIMYQYTVRVDDRAKTVARSIELYMWSKTTMRYTRCNQTCQGVKIRHVVCVSRTNGAIVSSQHCQHLTKPEDSLTPCHTTCELSWEAVPASDCSARCNEIGVMRQEIRCRKDSTESPNSSRNHISADQSQSGYISADQCAHLPGRPADTVSCRGSCLDTRWIYTEWSQCSRSCGGGEQHRNASCWSGDGVRMHDSRCQDSEIKPTRRQCGNVECPHWVEGDWSGCSVTCGSGFLYRSVTCQQGGSVVDRSLCAHTYEPMSRSSCAAASCPVWDVGKWGPCTVTCGKGVQERLVMCRTAQGSALEDSRCDAATRPRDRISCRESYCPTPSTPSPPTPQPLPPAVRTPVYDRRHETGWRTGGWTECSAACGMGHRERYVSCRDLEGRVAPDSACSHLERPSASEHCMVRPCGHWRTGDWTQCSRTCGPEGEESRYVACVVTQSDHSQIIVEAAQCDSASQPPTIRRCNMGDCPSPTVPFLSNHYNRHIEETTRRPNQHPPNRTPDRTPDRSPDRSSDRSSDRTMDRTPDRTPERMSGSGIVRWRTGPWSPCSSTCLSGFQMRRVVCQDESGNDSDKCSRVNQPQDRQSCNMGPCPVWNFGAWGPCSSSCGEGVQRRIVHCQLPDGQLLPEANCLDFAPPSSQACTVQNCQSDNSYTRPQHPHWVKGNWSPYGMRAQRAKRPPKTKITRSDILCSVTCGKGRKARQVACVDGNGRNNTVLLAPQECESSGTKPHSSKPCKKSKCPRWKTSPWSECSTQCGDGTMKRDAVCVTSRKREVSPSLCFHLPRPQISKSCHMSHCDTFIWRTGNWSSCSSSCGASLSERIVLCIERTSERLVDDRYCNATTKPDHRKECRFKQCNTLWVATDWTACSTTCDAGYQKRVVTCRSMASEGWLLPGQLDPSECPQTNKPISDRRCNYGECSGLYHWRVSAWSSCSKSCGFGMAYRDVYCISVDGSNQPKEKCDIGFLPDSSKQCYSGPCYASSCKELKEISGMKKDGEYKLYIHNKLLSIYCHDMTRSQPTEYLTLPAGQSENYSKVYGKWLTSPTSCITKGDSSSSKKGREDCGGGGCDSGRGENSVTYTEFSRVRLNVTSLYILGDDFIFSTANSSSRVSYASAGDCFASNKNCPLRGIFRINLKGTQFRIQSSNQWETSGVKAYTDFNISTDGQIVSGECGGSCGYCKPNGSRNQLYLKILS